MGSQVPFASAVALTRTVREDVKPALQNEMKTKFDRPTPYAMNSLFIKPATKANLTARIWVKDNTFGKGTPAIKFIGPQIYGGARGQKGMEKALQAAGLMPSGFVAVPAAGAQLDSYGNPKRSQIVQILSQLKVQQKAGYDSKASKSAASKRTVKRQGVTYFALPTPFGRLMPGVYLKRKFARGSAIRPVFIFVPSANYKARYAFHAVGVKVAQQRFPVRFDQEMEKAMRTAIPRNQQSLF